ncbi:bifunctional DNA primase/polymerase [Streptomyces mirabilis]
MSTHSQPDPRWAYVLLKRQTQFHVRKPVVAEDDSRYRDTALTAMWDGIKGVSQEDLRRTVDGGYDVGVLTGQSGLVVLDCDVKHYEAEVDFKVNGSTAQFEVVKESHTEYGVADLEREVLKLGHAMDELQTYTVKSKSDGRHLYFWQNPELWIQSQAQREAWHVDVKASRNTWVAAPPSAHYEVLDDREPAVGRSPALAGPVPERDQAPPRPHRGPSATGHRPEGSGRSGRSLHLRPRRPR